MTQKLTMNKAKLDRLRDQPDPRQKAPELQKRIQNGTRDILKHVRMLSLYPGTASVILLYLYTCFCPV